MEEIKIRNLRAEDKPFIINSWLKSYKEQPFAKDIPKDIYYKFHSEIIRDILNRETTKVLLAVATEDEDVIVGYVVLEEGRINIFHYIYVKRAFNNLGIAKRLIKESGIKKGYATHLTKSGKPFIDKSGLIYNPYLKDKYD